MKSTQTYVASLTRSSPILTPDSQTFDILDAYTWRADVNSFAALDSQIAFGPTYALEYSTREVYGANIVGWGAG